MPVLLDFETRSRADLKKVGGRLYAEHPSTEALCCVLYDTDGETVSTWVPGQPPPVRPDDVLAAHNASGFDRFIAARVWGPEYGGRDWIDTSELARRAGLPGALDALGTRWLGLSKDKVASRFTAGLSTCRRPSGKKNPAAISAADWSALTPAEKRERGAQKKITPADLERVKAYCASDVQIIAEGWPLLEPYLTDSVFGGWEADSLAVDRIVNDRGICFDSELAHALLEIDRRNTEREIASAARVTGLSVVDVRQIAGSPALFAEVTGLPNAQAKTLEDVKPDDDAEVYALCKARTALATIARGKLEAGLARVSADGRLRDSHRYYGAHTGRDAHRGFQSGNIPRPQKEYEEWKAAEVDACVVRALKLEALTPGEIDICLRATHMGSPGHELAVEDFSGVEARATAWIAHDDKAIEVFLSGRDVYKVNATTIFPGLRYEDVNKVQRTAGKMGELACGYQGGPGAVDRIAKGQGVDLMALGVDPQNVVNGWRALHPKIVRLWRDMNDAFLCAARGSSARVDRFEFVPSSDGLDVALFLPSGRPIIYGNVQIGRGQYGPECTYVGGWEPVWKCPRCPKKESTSPAPLDARADDRSTCPKCFGSTLLVGREKVYGGLLTENGIQALCRDLMFDALIRAEEAGLCPVLRVHDELVCDVPACAVEEAQAELHQIMITLPEWAKGFPVGAAGHHGRRYRK